MLLRLVCTSKRWLIDLKLRNLGDWVEQSQIYCTQSRNGLLQGSGFGASGMACSITSATPLLRLQVHISGLNI